MHTGRELILIIYGINNGCLGIRLPALKLSFKFIIVHFYTDIEYICCQAIDVEQDARTRGQCLREMEEGKEGVCGHGN